MSTAQAQQGAPNLRPRANQYYFQHQASSSSSSGGAPEQPGGAYPKQPPPQQQRQPQQQQQQQAPQKRPQQPPQQQRQPLQPSSRHPPQHLTVEVVTNNINNDNTEAVKNTLNKMDHHQQQLPPVEQLTIGSSVGDGARDTFVDPTSIAMMNAMEGLPSEAQLVLICLDYLRDLRRAYPAEDLQTVEGLNADYLSIACYALGRVFTAPPQLNRQNDCMLDPPQQSQQNRSSSRPNHPSLIPTSMEEINRDLLYVDHPRRHKDPAADGDKKKEEDPADFSDSDDPYTWYEYDDMHPSNAFRFYPLSGLASGPSLKGPLTLGEIAAAGLAGLGARARSEAEQEMITSPLFEQFVQAVKSKGFFMDPDNDTPLVNPALERARLSRQTQNYEDRHAKVVAKFRTKLATKAESTSTPGTPIAPGTPLSLSSPMRSANVLAMSCAERQRRRREQALELAKWRNSASGGNSSTPSRPNSSHQPFEAPSPRSLGMTPERGESGAQLLLTTDNPMDVEQAERFKAEGNVYMQKKLYPQAVQSYTQALKLSPGGPHSHVYFSNRAAALLSMKKFPEAILDSERSLALRPDYGKAHARLGLAHFLSGNYRQSMEAYTVSLKYDPLNASSKSYLEKAAKRLAEAGTSYPGTTGAPIQNSFSLVSEWESSQRHQQQQVQLQQQQQVLQQQIQPPSPRMQPPPQQQQMQQPMALQQPLEQQQQPPVPQQVQAPVLQQQPPTPTQQLQSQLDPEEQERIHEAEKFKVNGNAFMAQREYTAALEAYTTAIQCSPEGPQSHVYYSNRAAALCYLERYRDAVADSEQSLVLVPAYGKAHARLGLSRFFLQDYAGAVAAYTAALQHDPDNAASKSYLAKARAKLEGQSSRSSSRNRSRPCSRNPSPSAQMSQPRAHQQSPSHRQQSPSQYQHHQ